MIVYHGSNSIFDHLVIDKRLCTHESTKLNEGYGIYFSIDKSVVRSYGNYCYTIMIDDKYFLDFRDESVCLLYITSLRNYIYQQLNVDISQFCNLSNVMRYLHCGRLSLWEGVGREIMLLLDSNPFYYKKVCDTKAEKVNVILRNYAKRNLYAYMFHYNVKDKGVIKNVDDRIVRIVDRESVSW